MPKSKQLKTAELAAKLQALDYHLRLGKKLPPELQQFGAQHVRNWPKNPNRYFGLTKPS